MGNCCYEDPRVLSYIDDVPKTQRELKIEPLSASMRNSFVINELRNLPPISKHIENRMEELGPFIDKDLKDLGPIYKLKNMSVYQGHLKNNKFSGPGRLFLGDGSIIESEFENGEPKNQTRIFRTNGDYFSGTIIPSNHKEYGIVQEKGIKYEGEMLNKKPHGIGKEVSESYTYEGIYDNGKKIEGVLDWNIDQPEFKQSYKGSFKDNLLDGNGVLINSHGKYIGSFERGVKNGFGVFEEVNGEKYEGFFCKGKKDGQGKVFNKNGSLKLEGKWRNGKLIESAENI